MKNLLAALSILLSLCCAVSGDVRAQTGSPMVPNGGYQPTNKSLYCTTNGTITNCVSSDGSNWGCTAAQPAVCTVPASLVNGEAIAEGCSGGQGGGGGQTGAGTAGGGGGGGGACVTGWRLQLSPGGQININVGVPGVGGAIGSNASGLSATTTTISGAGVLTPFADLRYLGANSAAGSGGTGGTGGTGGGQGGTTGSASGVNGTKLAAVLGPGVVPGSGGGGGGPTAGTAGNGGSSVAFGGAAGGTGNGAGGGGAACFKAPGNAGGTSGSATPIATGFCSGAGGGATNQAGANGSPGYLILDAVY